jgi:asparagine synthase (glutamine-hydrolysing)
MCGILGILTDPDRESLLSQHDVLAMRDCMAVRGLASSSFVQRQHVVLAARLQFQQGERPIEQPVFSANGRFALLYDGCLFQLDALRDELSRLGFQSPSNACGEILLNAWLAWGKSSVRKLHGSFAIVVADFIEHRCWLIRDRCGAKPLFYARIGSDFVFASTLKSITRHPEFVAAPHFPTIRHYLATLRLTFDDQTLLKGIHTVLPAEIVTFQHGTIQRETYWTPDQPSSQLLSYRDAVDELNDHLSTSIKQSLADLPTAGRVGALLNGEVNSSILGRVAIERLGRPLVTRCGGIGNQDKPSEAPESDFQFAQQLAREFKSDHREVRTDSQTFLETWRQLIHELGMPLASPHDVLMYRAVRTLKCDANVVLMAEGADEIFCGYNVPHWAGRDYENAQTFSNVQSREAEQTRDSLCRQYGRAQFYSASDHFFLTNGLVTRNTLNSILRDEFWVAADEQRAIERYYDRLFDDQGDRSMAEKWAHVLFRVHLESLLSKVDRLTSQTGLRARLPYTDHRLVEFAFRLPHHYKIDLIPGETQPWLSAMELNQRQSIRSKRILRSAASNWVTSEIANRPRQNPNAAVAGWLADDLRPWIAETLRENQFFHQIFNDTAIEELQTLPRQLSMWNWPIVNLALWGDQVF